MKPAPFQYHRPESLDEAAECLASLPDAKVLAGGQSLVPILALRLSRFDHLVDLGAIEELRGVEATGGAVRVLSMTTQAELARHACVTKDIPLLARATSFIGHFQIRNRGTIGGSIAHADPSGEYPAVAVALDAEIEIVSHGGSRRLGASEFFKSTFTTSLQDHEIIRSVTFPIRGPASGFAIEEVARRRGDFALVGAAVGLEVDGRSVSKARIVLFGVGGTPVRATAAEEALMGCPVSKIDFDAVAARGVASLSPPDDVHASGSYRRHAGRAVIARTLRTALREAQAHG